MFFFARHWAGSSWAEPGRAAASLGLFSGRPADSNICGDDFFADLPSPRAQPRRHWRVARSPSGFAVLFCGWIDHVAGLSEDAGSAFTDGAELYGAAVERWGVDADRRIVGTYAAIVCMPDGTVRLSRSPWASKSLFFHADRDVLLACSIPRPLFAAGLAKRLRAAAVDALFSMELPDDVLSSFEGVETVPHGAVVLLGRGSRKTLRWYDPVALPAVRLKKDEDYVEAASALLGEAVGKAMALGGRHGVTLSGGLDSSIVCAEMLQQLPSGKRLPSFTFHPLPEWDGSVVAHKFGDDRPWVEAFAAMHPALDPVFADNSGIGFDDRAEQMFLACDAGYPARLLGSVYHGVFEAAAKRGCEWLFTADAGNMTFSNTAMWAYGEFLLTGKWHQLWRLAQSRLNDPRPVWRRIAAHAVMPQLPEGLRNRVRSIIHRRSEPDQFANPFLSEKGRLAAYRRPENLSASIMTVDREESREHYIRSNYHAAGLGMEIGHGYEQVFGLRLRDVTAYRPLIEFCLALPTDQFVRDGETRRLARRMGLGRLPEAQRTNRLYGEHNVDWHARLTPRLGELRLEVENIASHPQIGPLVDTDAMLHLLDNWPEKTPEDHALGAHFRFFLPALIYITRYVDFETGRNRQG